MSIDIDNITQTINDHINKITRIIEKKKICLIDLNNLNKKIELLNNNEEISQIKKKLEDKEKSLNDKIQLLKKEKKEFENKEKQKIVFTTTLAESIEEKKQEIINKILIIQNIIEPLKYIYTEFTNIFSKTEEIKNTINLEDIENIVNEEIKKIGQILSDKNNTNFICNKIEEDINKAIDNFGIKIRERNSMIEKIIKEKAGIFFGRRKINYTRAWDISKEIYNATEERLKLNNNRYNCEILNDIRQIFTEIIELCQK